jgi:hypothetical protein
MVVKHLKDLKKRRQAMIAAMEPILFRSYKMGFLDCTRATIEFINDIDSPAEKRQQIIEHISTECMKTLSNQCPPLSFNQHHEIVFSNVNPPDNFMPFSMLDTDMEWPSLEEKLGFSPIGSKAQNFLLPDVKPSLSLLKIAEPARISAFNVVAHRSANVDANLESPSTSGTSVTCNDEMPQQSIFINDDTSEDGDDGKLIIDDHNNNQAAWRPWL